MPWLPDLGQSRALGLVFLVAGEPCHTAPGAAAHVLGPDPFAHVGGSEGRASFRPPPVPQAQPCQGHHSSKGRGPYSDQGPRKLHGHSPGLAPLSSLRSFMVTRTQHKPEQREPWSAGTAGQAEAASAGPTVSSRAGAPVVPLQQGGGLCRAVRGGRAPQLDQVSWPSQPQGRIHICCPQAGVHAAQTARYGSSKGQLVSTSQMFHQLWPRGHRINPKPSPNHTSSSCPQETHF